MPARTGTSGGGLRTRSSLVQATSRSRMTITISCRSFDPRTSGSAWTY